MFIPSWIICVAFALALFAVCEAGAAKSRGYERSSLVLFRTAERSSVWKRQFNPSHFVWLLKVLTIRNLSIS